jgi:hypothetical protein
MEQPVGWKGMQEFSIRFHGHSAGSLTEADLFQGERLDLPGDLFPADGLSVLLDCVDDWILKRTCGK